MIDMKSRNKVIDKIAKIDFELPKISNFSKINVMQVHLLCERQLSLIKKRIIEQIYILNKLYDKWIVSNKIKFDNIVNFYCENFNQLNKQSNYFKLLQKNYENLARKIKEYKALQDTANQNIDLYKKNKECLLNSYINFYDKSLKEGNNTEKILKYQAKLEPFTYTLPDVTYCLNDVLKKQNYVSNLIRQTNTYKMNKNYEGEENYEQTK